MFEHLQEKGISPFAVSLMPLPEVSPGAVLKLRFAGEENPQYWNALLKLAGSRPRRKGPQGVTADEIAENRDHDRLLVGRYVLVGWEGIQAKDADGEFVDVAFTRELAQEFCQKLPRHVFDSVRAWASDASRFVAGDSEPLPDPEELAGN